MSEPAFLEAGVGHRSSANDEVLPLVWTAFGGLLLAVAALRHIDQLTTSFGDWQVHAGLASEVELDNIWPLPYPVFHWAARSIDLVMPGSTPMGAAIAVGAVAAGATVLVTSKAFARAGTGAAAAGVLGVVTSFAGPVNLPTWPRNLYFGYLSPSTWHNPTVLAAKPLSVGLFLAAGTLLATSERVTVKAEVALAVLTVAVFATKPSLAPALVPGALVVGAFVARPALGALTRGLAAPAIVVLAVQAIVIQEQSGGSFRFAPFEVAASFSTNLGPKAVLSVLLPVTAIVLVPAILADRRLALGWATTAFAAGQWFLLAETGDRAEHGNLGWGVQLAILCLYVATVRSLIVERREIAVWRGALLAVAGFAHLAGGLALWSVYATGREQTPWL